MIPGEQMTVKSVLEDVHTAIRVITALQIEESGWVEQYGNDIWNLPCFGDLIPIYSGVDIITCGEAL